MALTYQHVNSREAGAQATGLDRNGRVIGLRWKKNVITASVNTEDQMFWYDGLQQVTDRQRGSLVGSPPYSGISSLQQNEQFTFDEPTGAQRRETDHARKDGPEGEAQPNQPGNWLSDYNSTGGPLSQSRTHNPANEITSLDGPTGVVWPVYDAVGNCTFALKFDVWQEGYYFTFDAWNRMVEVANAGVSYRYDALFRRIVVHPGTDDDYYYTDQWQVSEVYRGSTFQNDIIKRDGATAFGTDRYGLRDKLNIVAVTDGSGAVDLRIAYDTFGKARYLDSDWEPAINSKLWNFVFHGYQLDFETGFLAVRFRMYHPILGRWLSRDPIGEEGGLNLYCFCQNNPATLSDVYGLDSVKLRCGPVLLGQVHCEIVVECKGKLTGFGIGGPKEDNNKSKKERSELQKISGGFPPPEYADKRTKELEPNQKEYALDCGGKTPCEIKCCLVKLQQETSPPPYYALSQNSNTYAREAAETCGCTFKVYQDGETYRTTPGGKNGPSRVPNIIRRPKGAWGWGWGW